MDASVVRDQVFISYSHKDEKWLKRLHVHLTPLKREGKVTWWDDKEIEAGDLWREKIKKSIGAAKVAILLISADFFASNFIAEYELPPLLKAAESEGAVILPVIISPSRFQNDKSLSEFQSFNNPSRPLISMKVSEREDLWNTLGEQIVKILNAAPLLVPEKKTDPYLVPSSALLTRPDILPYSPDEPPAVGIFINRHDDIDAMKKFLSNDARRLIIIQGFIGIGKTQLAAKLAKEIKERFKAVCWITCKENQDSPDFLFSRLQVFFETNDEHGLRGVLADQRPALFQVNISKLIGILRQHSYLLIFDKFQHWLSPDLQLKNPDVQTIFSGILRADHQSKVLLISDNRLLLDPRSFSLPVGSTMERTLLGLDYVHATELLKETGLNSENEELLHRIVLYCDGNPSVLQIFSYLVTSLHRDPDELLSSDETRSDFNGLLKQATNDLNKDAYNLLQQLSVFRPSIGKQHIISLGFSFNTSAGPLLDRFLLAEHLALQEYHVSTIVKNYILKDISAGTLKNLHLHAAAFYTDQRKNNPPANYKELELALEEAYHYAESGNAETSTKIIISVTPYLIDWGYINMAEENILQLLHNNRGKDEQAQALFYQAVTADLRGNYDLALGSFKKALEWFTENMEYNLVARICFRIGRIYNALHEFDLANISFKACIDTCEKHNVKDGRAASLLGMAWNLQEQSADIEANLDEVLSLYRQSITDASESNDIETFSSAHRQIGFLLWTKTKQKNEALQHYELALEAAIAKALVKEQGGIYSELGYLYSEWNQTEKARANCGNAIDIFLSLGDFYGLSGAYFNLGKTYEQENNFETAICYYNKSKITAANINNNGGEAWASFNIGRLLSQQGRIAEAESVLQKAISLSKQYRLGETRTLAEEELKKLSQLV